MICMFVIISTTPSVPDRIEEAKITAHEESPNLLASMEVWILSRLSSRTKTPSPESRCP